MDNPLKKILGSVSTFLTNKNKDSVIGIDIGSSAIKIVEIKKRGGKAILETYGAVALGPYADTDIGRVTNLSVEKISEALKEVLKQSGASTPFCALSIPMQSGLVFIIDLPPQIDVSKKIDSIISIEARKYIPVPITEVTLDYFILPQKEKSYEEINNPDLKVIPVEKTEVLVVAVQNDAISKLRSITSEHKLDAGFFEVEIFASVRANFEHELYPVLLVDFGASRTKLSIVEFGIIKSYHTINRGSADITDSIAKSLDISFSKAEELKKEFGLYNNKAEEKLNLIIKGHLDYIFSEINNILLVYEKKYNRTISKVIFSGGGCLLKGLKEVAINDFKAEIEIGHPFSKINAPVFLEKVLENTGPEFAIAIGLALRRLQ